MALNRIAKKTTSTLQLQSLLENILAEIITIFDAYSADIFLSTKNQAQLELAAHAGEPLDNKSWAAPIILDQTVLEEIFAQNTDIITGDIQHFTNLLPHYASLDNKEKHLSCAAAIMRQPRRTGVLVIVPKEGQAFQAPERSLLITISGQVSLAIENSRLHSDLLSKIDEKELINDNLEEALKQLTDSEEKARQTIETVTDGIIVTDTEGEITDINHAGLKMCNLSRKEDILGLNVLQWLGGKHHDILKTTISQGETGINLSTTITNDKYQFEAELHAAAIRNKKGQAYGLVFSIRDVTEAKKAEAVLRESEEKYRTIFESANDIMILLDNKRNILDVNPRISDVGGYDREELIGKNFSSLTKILTKKSLLVITANYLKRLSGLNVPTYEVEMYKKNGEKATIEVNAKPVKRSGEIVGDLVVLRDVSERRKAVTQLMEQKALTDRILASSTNAVAVIGQDRRLKIANHTFELLFQLGKGTGEGLDIGLLTQVPELVEAISKVIAYGQSIIALEFRINYDITEYTMLADIVSMGNNEVLLTIRDITMTVERQERLYLTDRLASVGEMASGVAHELNNPLTSIIGLSQLLTEEKIPDNIRDDIGFISSEAQRASRVVKNLLTFARRHETERRPVNITQIVDDVLKLRAYENKVNNIEIQTIIPQDLPQIMADYFQIQQVFLNIILNAEQAMKESHGSGKLTISAEKTGNIIRISFIDNGPGIAKENMKRIFDPFFTTKEVGKGTGLGLSICYGIVTDHNGKILVESKCGKGTTFIVEFPVHNN